MTFAHLELDPRIAKAITYPTPSPIQARCIPEILLGKDVVASAQTGTGKTAAFVLPALHRISGDPSKKPRILILSPTRELASQITTAVSKYGQHLRFNIANLVGGMPYRQQLRDLSRAVDIIVATPGRLMDHMQNKRVDLSGIEMLILDEADRMLDMGFIDDVQDIAKKTPDTRQTLLFSATIDKKLAHVVRHLLKDPVRIDLSNEKISPTQIKQAIYLTDSYQHKTRIFQHYLQNENIFKGIIFSGTKINADKLAGMMNDLGYKTGALHGDLNQNKRNRTVEELRRGKIQFVVATDVAARGIDISDVTHVINYDLPRFCEDYVHRIGRTGRAGKTGTAISFVLPAEIRHLTRIEQFTGQKLTREVVAGMEPKKETPHQKTFSKENSSGRKKTFGKRPSDGKSSFKKSARSDDRPSFKRSERSDDRPSFKRSERSDDRPSFKRGRSDDKPGFKRSERSDDRPSFKRSERSDDRSSFKRNDRSDDRPSFKRSERSDDRPSFKRSERSEDRPSFKRGRSDDKPGFKRSERSDDRPSFKRSARSDDKPSFKRSERSDDRPSFKRNDRSDDRPSFKRGRSDDKPGFKKSERSDDSRISFKKSGSNDRPGFKKSAGSEEGKSRFKKSGKPGFGKSDGAGFKKRVRSDEGKPAFKKKKRAD